MTSDDPQPTQIMYGDPDYDGPLWSCELYGIRIYHNGGTLHAVHLPEGGVPL